MTDPHRRMGFSVLVLAVSSCLPFLGSAQDDPYFSVWKRIEAVREVAESVRHVAGEYPSDLSAMCPEPSGHDRFCDSLPDALVRDRWGHEIWFESSEAHYRIGSLGPDGLRGTPDDLEIDSAIEGDRVSAFSGCYLIEPDDPHHHEKRLLVLDTARIHFLSSERRAWVPSPERLSVPKWHPWRQDSVLVTWGETREVMDLRLFPRADTLGGVAHSPTGVRDLWGHTVPFPVKAVRIACDAA